MSSLWAVHVSVAFLFSAAAEQASAAPIESSGPCAGCVFTTAWHVAAESFRSKPRLKAVSAESCDRVCAQTEMQGQHPWCWGEGAGCEVCQVVCEGCWCSHIRSWWACGSSEHISYIGRTSRGWGSGCVAPQTRPQLSCERRYPDPGSLPIPISVNCPGACCRLLSSPRNHSTHSTFHVRIVPGSRSTSIEISTT